MVGKLGKCFGGAVVGLHVLEEVRFERFVDRMGYADLDRDTLQHTCKRVKMMLF
jgi:hypothetical protein